MKITVSRHIFGSVRGYTTLAKSEDLSPEEIADLEIFSFGQTNESTYMNSLETDPAYISRPLRSGRWAVTRVFQGKPDEHNRTTLLFVSAVITTEDWVYLLKCDVNELLYYRDLWQWDGKEKLEPIEVAVEGGREAADAEIRSRVLCLVAAVEKYSSDKDTTIVVRASDFDVEVLRLLNMVLPLKLKQGFSCAARSLNDGLPLTVISMAKEGSLGNSKRSTISWTPTSTADDCVYTESLARFWRPGAEPPWQFIDRCRSFSVDLEAARVSGLDERVVRRKRLRYEIKKRGVRRKRHISWKLGLIFLACAVLVCLGAGIAIRATLAKAQEEKKVGVLVEKARGFLDGNSLEKGFPANRRDRQQVIKECKKLRYGVEELVEPTDNPVLKALAGELDEWLTLAEDAHQSYNTLDSLHQQFIALKLSKEGEGYPVQKKIDAVLNLKESLRTNIDGSKYLIPSYISKHEKSLNIIKGWLDTIHGILVKKEREIAEFVEEIEQPTAATPYSDEQNAKYTNWKVKLQEFKEDDSLANGKDSPINKHSEIAQGIIRKIHGGLARCDEALTNMNISKKKAEESLQAFYDIINDPNITKIENLGDFLKAKDYLEGLDKLWPDKKIQAEKEWTTKFTSNAGNHIDRWQDTIDETDAELPAEERNSDKIRELRRECAEFRKISAEGNIGNIVQQMKTFDEKLRNELASISKSKQKANEESKSNGS